MKRSSFIFGRPLEAHPTASSEDREFECVIVGVWEQSAAGKVTSRRFVALVEIARKEFDRAGYRAMELVCPVCLGSLTEPARCAACDIAWEFIPGGDHWPALLASRTLTDGEIVRVFGCDASAVRGFSRELTPSENLEVDRWMATQ